MSFVPAERPSREAALFMQHEFGAAGSHRQPLFADKTPFLGFAGLDIRPGDRLDIF